MIDNLGKIAEIYFEKDDYAQSIVYSIKRLIVIKCLHNDQVDPVRTANILNIGMALLAMTSVLATVSFLPLLHVTIRDIPSCFCFYILFCASSFHVLF